MPQGSLCISYRSCSTWLTSRWPTYALLPTGSSDLAEQLQSVCRRAGFLPVDAARADALPGLFGHVAANGCVTLVPASVATEAPAGVTVKVLSDVDPDLFLRSGQRQRPQGDQSRHQVPDDRMLVVRAGCRGEQSHQ